MAYFTMNAIEVDDLRLEDAFAYLADFSTVQEWDPGVVRAHRNDHGPVGVGSSFEVEASFMGRTVPLTYKIIDFVPNESVSLRAENGSVISLDTLTFTATDSGAKVQYEAELTGKGLLRWAEPVLQRLFNKICRAGGSGLKEHLIALVHQGNPNQANQRASDIREEDVDAERG